MIRKLRKRGFTLIELMIVVAIIGILAAIAIPNFIKFQARSKQGEAKANLKSLFTAQRSYFQEKDKYLNTINDIGFGPERGNRYAYWNGGGTWTDRSTLSGTTLTTDTNITVDTYKFQGAATNPAAVLATIAYAQNGSPDPGQPGVLPANGCPLCNFQGHATGNIDTDATIDTWFISSKDASVTAACGNSDTAAPAGTPFNTNNDVTC
jgi:type IV pilus assembly protein PilA